MKIRGLLKNRRWKLLNHPLGRNRRGISTTIEYVLFISLAITMSLIVYVWLKSYIPKDALECSDGVSILLQSYDYKCDLNRLTLNLKNSGRFDIDGYYIKATNKSTQTLATKDLAKYTSLGSGNNFVSFVGNSRGEAGSTMSDTFTLPLPPGANSDTCSSDSSRSATPNSCIYSVDIIPVREETINDRKRLFTCTSAKIKQDIECTPQVCDNDLTCDVVDGETCSGCPGDCGACPATYLCDNDLDDDGDGKIDYNGPGTIDPGCNSATDNDETDPAGNYCGDGIELSPNNEIPAINEECDDGNTINNDACVIDSAASYMCKDARCGDNYLWNQNGGTEECDDGNLASGDGCSGGTSGTDVNACKIETLNLGYFGFESGTQGWSYTGADSDRNNDRSKVDDNGVDGGSWAFHLRHDGSDAITDQNFDFTGFKEITIKWRGYYTGLDTGDNDCLEFKIDNTKIDSWGTSGCDNNGITQGNWAYQEKTITNTQFTFDSSVNVKFEAEMNHNSDNFYVDGINISGRRY
ncbi:hypothetical protein HY449_04595 [Candidatus Pacearchaeota archaeon]|nr:hypothetical protein [Candidatus Pacearchaeota archaeon]